jgi:predicted DNA-binding transcriptional regulator AlpA
MTKEAIPVAASNFDKLPDSALVDVRVVSVLEGVNVATVWRRVARGMFPKPQPKIPGTNTTRWLVGDIRAARRIPPAAA